MVFLFILALIEILIKSALFWIYLVVGITWFISAAIINKKIQDEDKKSLFKTVRAVVCAIFWVGLIAVVVLSIVFAGGIRLM